MARSANLVIIGVYVGVAIGFGIAVCAFFGIRWYRKRSDIDHSSSTRSLTILPIRMNGVGTSIEPSASIDSSALTNSFAFHGPQQTSNVTHRSWWDHNNKDVVPSTSGILKYPYKDLQKATQNFTTILGQGSFGPVYKATMPTNQVVAVKALASDSKQGEKEFQTEVSLLEEGQHVLNWDERLQVALDISHRIEYLHEGAIPPVIHRDLKSANILLDKSMRAKVADFGLSKEVVLDRRVSSLKGTYGSLLPYQMLTSSESYEEREIMKSTFKTSIIVANPGCYPTSIQLPLVPLIKAKLIELRKIIIDAKSGVSGAGRGAKEANLYTEIAEGIHSYGITRHRHVSKIEQGLNDCAQSKVTISFTPHLMPMSRGMQSTIYVEMTPGTTVDDQYQQLKTCYQDEEFVVLLEKGAVPHTRNVRGSNYYFMNVYPDRIPGRAIIVSVIDNLVKGASGQAMQNLNLMMGLSESTGLLYQPLFP